jgi:hypothetical protein
VKGSVCTILGVEEEGGCMRDVIATNKPIPSKNKQCTAGYHIQPKPAGDNRLRGTLG